MKAHQLTCHQLVDAYLQRIAKYDKNEPPINAIVLTNPDALKEADELDRRFASGGLTGPLHCVPTIVKDNYETIGLQSADGSLTLKGFVSDKDAFLVKRIKAAGAIVLAKSNMAEFAFSPNETVNSLLGTTRNPYASDARARGLERRHGRGRRRQLRPRRPRLGHRQLDSRALVAQRARRHPLDDGADEPGGRDSALATSPTSPVR